MISCIDFATFLNLIHFLIYLTGLLFDFMWLILDEGWEANLDRQQRGITVAPIVAPGMRR